MNSQPNLILIRGVSGSGKSTFAKIIGCQVFSADDWFTQWDGTYSFDSKQLPMAHRFCQENCRNVMEIYGHNLAVANTFTQEWEMKPYFDLAEKYGYKVFVVIVENRHGESNIHEVPESTVQKQRERFDIKL